MAKFKNRERELRALDRAVGPRDTDAGGHRGAGLAVVSGRRRVGKTALLDQFTARWSAAGGAAVFLPGTRAPVAEALARLEERLRAVLPPTPGDLLDLGRLTSWDAALGYLLARTREERLLVVFDEFPYLCEADPALPSTLQARWDHRGDAQLSLILAGSHVGLMEELVAADAPLFGRADAHLRVRPFGWHEAGLLVGGDDPAAWLEAWVTVGGMPRYLSLWDPRHDALTNLADLLDGPGAPLGDEGTVVLQELAAGSAAARVLELIALGARTFSTIRDRCGLAPATTSEALSTLEELGLVDRITPVGEDPRRTRSVRYDVRDPFLRIWLSVVGPHREGFELSRGAAVLAAQQPIVAASQTLGFRSAVADWLGAREQATCGPWWPRTAPADGIDLLALRGTTVSAVGAARWAAGVDGHAERSQVALALGASPFAVPDQIHAFARGGEGVLTPQDLYA